MGKHLGVGLRREHVSVGDHRLIELHEIFKNAVVDDGDLADLVDVRMGVVVYGLAMRSRPGVANPRRRTFRRGLTESLGQNGELPRLLLHPQSVALQHDAGRVVAPILQARKAIQQDR